MYTLYILQYEQICCYVMHFCCERIYTRITTIKHNLNNYKNIFLFEFMLCIFMYHLFMNLYTNTFISKSIFKKKNKIKDGWKKLDNFSILIVQCILFFTSFMDTNYSQG